MRPVRLPCIGHRPLSRPLTVLAAAVLAACGAGGSLGPPPDAAAAEDAWPDATGGPEGAVLLGTNQPGAQPPESFVEVSDGDDLGTQLGTQGLTMIASDVSSAMAERLDRRVREEELAAVEVRTMSAHALELPDASFDGALCANALHVMEAPEQALAELRRVLVPGGVLVAPTFCHGVDRPRRLLSRALSLVSPFIAHSRFAPDEVAGLIQGCGFEIRRMVMFPGIFPIAYVVAEAHVVA